MATTYSVIDNAFLSKIKDHYLLNMDVEYLQELIDGYRRSAIVRFKHCKKLKYRDEDTKEFTQDLTDEEIEILSSLMVLEWVKNQVNSIEVMKMTMTLKDYTVFSNAQQLNSLLSMRKATAEEVDTLIVSYTYSENSLDDLRKG